MLAFRGYYGPPKRTRCGGTCHSGGVLPAWRAACNNGRAAGITARQETAQVRRGTCFGGFIHTGGTLATMAAYRGSYGPPKPRCNGT